MAWNLSCPDWRERIKAGRSLVPDLPLNQREAERAIAIFNKLRLPDVTGRPLLAEAGADWFREIVAALFGAYEPAAGGTPAFRHITELFTLVPKKNAKTTYSAALMVTALLMNKRPRAEFALIAPTQEVANVAFSQAIGMIEGDPYLEKRMHVREHLKTVKDRVTGAQLKIKTWNPKVVTGMKPAGVLLDELHTVPMNEADRVIGQLRGGLVSQPEGFLAIITTQSERPPTGVFKKELNKARAVRDGRLNAPMLPVLYEFPEDVDWKDTANWHLVTPNRGRSITVERLIPDYEDAHQAGEAELRRWASQHLNIEIGLGLRTDHWAGAEFWERAADASISLEHLLERSEAVVIGIDGGGLDDLFGLAVLGRDRETKDWLLWTHAWCHEGVLERRKSIAAQLREFEKAGELTIVSDALEDISDIVAVVEDIKARGLLAAVAADPAGLGEFVDAMAAIDVTAENKLLIGVPQGYALMNALKTSERKLANGTLKHGGSGLMAWCVGNLKIEPTATAIRATKQNAGDAKIDPAMALFDAALVMSRNPEPPGLSIFDRPDLWGDADVAIQEQQA